MNFRRRHRSIGRAALLGALLVVVAGCFGADAGLSGAGSGADGPVGASDRASLAATAQSDPNASTTTTTTVRPNTAPTLRPEVVVSAVLGRTQRSAIPVTDAEGDPVTVALLESDGPDGLALEGDSGGWLLTWTPTTTGTSVVPFVLRDDRGATRRAEVTVRATNPYRDGTLIGMGDSVASGHGLEKRDYLGRDDCWRSADETYPGSSSMPSCRPASSIPTATTSSRAAAPPSPTCSTRP